MKTTRKKHFSLIEVIIAVTIIALIAAIAAPRIFKAGDDAKVKLTEGILSNISGNIADFKMNTNKVPESLEEFVTNSRSLPGWKQISPNVPLDAWNNPIALESADNFYNCTLTSLGADGEPGGEGVNADIIFPQSK